jgi:F-type H+-transporting ATPase subunit epsilon
MSKPFRLTVLTPEQTMLDVQGVAWVQARLADGGPIGIYPGHAPLLAETVAAPLRYKDTSGEHAVDLSGGILQVHHDGVTVFSSIEASESMQAPDVSTEDERFERLAQELLGTLGAQPNTIQDTEPDAF